MTGLVTVGALAVLVAASAWRSRTVFHPADARRIEAQQEVRRRLAEQYARGGLTAVEYRDAHARLR